MRGRVRVVGVPALTVVGTLTLAGAAAGDVTPPPNHANGLGRLVQPQQAAAAANIREDPGLLAIRDRAGRVLVDVYAREGTPLATVRQRSEANGLKVVTQSADQQALEGYVAVGQVKALARTAGVATVASRTGSTEAASRSAPCRTRSTPRPRPSAGIR